MNVFWSGVLKWVMQIFAGILLQVSPAIVSELSNLLTNLYLKALATSNPWDDMAIGLLLDILKIPRPPPV